MTTANQQRLGELREAEQERELTAFERGEKRALETSDVRVSRVVPRPEPKSGSAYARGTERARRRFARPDRRRE